MLYILGVLLFRLVVLQHVLSHLSALRPLWLVPRLLVLDGHVRYLLVLRQLVSHLISELLVLLFYLCQYLARFVELIVEHPADFLRLRVNLLLRSHYGASGFNFLLLIITIQLLRSLHVPLVYFYLLQLVVLFLARLNDQQVWVVWGFWVRVVVVSRLLRYLIGIGPGRLRELVFDVFLNFALHKPILLGHTLRQNEVLRRDLTDIALGRVCALLLLWGQRRRL